MSPRVMRALRWAVAMGLIAIVVARFDVAAVAARIGSASPVLVLVAITGLIAVHLVGATAWGRLLEAFAGIHTDWRTTVRLYYAAQAIGSVTPGNLGADVYRIAAVDASTSRRTAAVPILLQRLTSTAALAVFAAFGFLVVQGGTLSGRPGLGAPAIIVGVSAIAVLIALAAGSIVRRRRSAGIAAVLSRKQLVAVTRDGFGLGLVFHGISLGLGWVLILAVDPATAGHALQVLAILAIARLAVVLPISPAGIGLQEAAVGVLFAQAGLDPEVALAAIVLNRVALLVVVMLGAAAMAGQRRAEPTTRAVAAVSAPPPAAARQPGR